MLLTPPDVWARGVGGGQPAHRLDEVASVAVVFGDAGGDGEDVGVEDDVLGRETGLLDEQPVGSGDDALAAFHRVRLAVFVEGHHDHRGAVTTA